MNSPMDVEQLRQRRRELGQEIHQVTLRLRALKLESDNGRIGRKNYLAARDALLDEQGRLNDVLRGIKKQLTEADPHGNVQAPKLTGARTTALMLRWFQDLEDFSRALHTIISERHCEECSLELWRCPICNSAQAMTSLFNRKPAMPGPAPF